MRGTKFFYQPR